MSGTGCPTWWVQTGRKKSLADLTQVVLSPHQQRWLDSQPFWMSPQFPLRRVAHRKRAWKRHIDAPWFQRLLEDIELEGLHNPVVLNNSPEHPDNTWPERERYSIRAGNNRILALECLGAATLPALVWGELPVKWRTGGPMSLDEANEFVYDGVIEIHWHGPVLVDATDPKVQFA